MTAQTADNPLLAAWDAPFGAPPLDHIKPEHFAPAFERALAEHRGEIDAIAGEAAEPGFDNTVAALERSGRAARPGVERVLRAGRRPHQRGDPGDRARHGAAAGAALERDPPRTSALFARHRCRCTPRGTARPDGRAGARAGALPRDVPPRRRRARRRRASSGWRRSTSGWRASARRSARTCSPTSSPTCCCSSEDDLAGLPDFAARGGARRRRRARPQGQARRHAGRSSVEPFLQFSARRDLREKAFRAWIARGDNGGATDNKPIIAEMTGAARRAGAAARLPELRALPARRHHGQDAGRPCAACSMRVWAPGARAASREERDALQAMVAAEGGNFALAPWDWRYYAEKLRKAQLRSRRERDQAVPASSTASSRRRSTWRTGCSASPSRSAPTCRSITRTCASGRCRRRRARTSALFFGDYFARPSKRSGAWMTSLRDQEKLDGEVRPLVLNVMNFNKGADGEPTLLSLRRRAHAVPRVRPRAARADVRRRPIR